MVPSSSSDLRHCGIELRVGDGDLLDVLKDGRKSSSRRVLLGWDRGGGFKLKKTSRQPKE